MSGSKSIAKKSLHTVKYDEGSKLLTTVSYGHQTYFISLYYIAVSEVLGCLQSVCVSMLVHNFGEAGSGLLAGMWRMWGVGVPLLMVTFDLCFAPPTLNLAHPNPSLSIHELEVQLRAASGWRRVCLRRVGDCVVPITQEVGRTIVLEVMALMSLCSFWCCRGCAVLVEMFVDFRWASSGLPVVSQIFIENGHPLVVLPLPDFQSLKYIKWTLNSRL